eukprot:scaffold6514_cov68-Isochrysis_galbana.AAC.1
MCQVDIEYLPVLGPVSQQEERRQVREHRNRQPQQSLGLVRGKKARRRGKRLALPTARPAPAPGIRYRWGPRLVPQRCGAEGVAVSGAPLWVSERQQRIGPGVGQCEYHRGGPPSAFPRRIDPRPLDAVLDATASAAIATATAAIAPASATAAIATATATAAIAPASASAAIAPTSASAAMAPASATPAGSRCGVRLRGAAFESGCAQGEADSWGEENIHGTPQGEAGGVFEPRRPLPLGSPRGIGGLVAAPRGIFGGGVCGAGEGGGAHGCGGARGGVGCGSSFHKVG